ncbi:hypothetical protein XELAEV_18033240mg [Xenopus laevis]|uniref:BVR A n=1 Tax=Xenopus laevis TaxID=8355 RepID=A0A974CKE8_XENLA|nr:hypothetical protein XELAEV_18033240mg [Xenopus laevis]
MFGVVVVGIGIVGSVRIRDILNPLQSSPSESLKLIGFVSRRKLDRFNNAKQIELDEALKSKDIDAAFICTDNQNHEESIRNFLKAGKHILVEYPMALSADAAYDLWRLAEQKGKVLHVEHIELLTEEYKQQKKEVQGKKLVEGVLHFTGGHLDENLSGFPSFSGIARLSWLVDLFGDLTLTAHFLTAENRPLTWVEERAPGMKRDKHIHFSFTTGILDTLPPSSRASVGPFMQDQNLFAKKLLGQVTREELLAEKQRILKCINLAEEIKKKCEP